MTAFENLRQDKVNGERPRFHIMSVDVEDYFQVEAFAGSIARESWDQWPSRVVDNTHRLLDLFDKYGVKGTFFFVGWVADKFPALVLETQNRGHEIACHSFWHRTIYKLTPDEFRDDTRRAKRTLEDACGHAIHGYRAPTWSVTSQCLWALEILAEEGFVYDSSIYPIRHDLCGLPSARRFPYIIEFPSGTRLQEFPPATISVFGFNLPAAGGGYLRILPSWYTSLAFRDIGECNGQAVCVYLHPWEIDPEQPRIHAGWRSRFRHYTNLQGMCDRVAQLLRKYRFTRYCDLPAIPENQRITFSPTAITMAGQNA